MGLNIDLKIYEHLIMLKGSMLVHTTYTKILFKRQNTLYLQSLVQTQYTLWHSYAECYKEISGGL